MKTITLVTSNPGKLAEWQRLFPAAFKLEATDIDLDEIQSLDLEAIITDKAKRAYELIGSPVIVEDITAGLEEWGGLPGPFIKFFEERLGMDALFKVASAEGAVALVTAIAAYYDGSEIIIARGDVSGSVVSARGPNGFGFDKCFMPAGQSKTYGEMTPAEKDSVSHRSKAIKALVAQLGVKD